MASAVPSTPTELAAPPHTPTPAPTSTPEMVLEGAGPDQAEEGRIAYLRTCALLVLQTLQDLMI